ncbi:hypothetical protein [Streptomyces sp. NPDC001876]|uniref:hypothetical protein n=1 Tax=Streptomyces sp. NPDC001876 TaxID=3154402 RepID=UPI00331B7A44
MTSSYGTALGLACGPEVGDVRDGDGRGEVAKDFPGDRPLEQADDLLLCASGGAARRGYTRLVQVDLSRLDLLSGHRPRPVISRVRELDVVVRAKARFDLLDSIGSILLLDGAYLSLEESKNIRRTSAVLRRFSEWPTQGYDLEMAKQAGL